MTLFWRVCFFACLTTVTVLSLVPAPPVPDVPVLIWDKFQHAVAYGVLTLCAGRAFTFSAGTRGGRWTAAALLALLIGGLMEGAQEAFTVSRSAEWGDFLADGIGAVFAWGVGVTVKPGIRNARGG